MWSSAEISSRHHTLDSERRTCADDDIALFVSCVDIPVGVDSLFERIAFIYNRLYLSRLNQLFQEIEVFRVPRDAQRDAHRHMSSRRSSSILHRVCEPCNTIAVPALVEGNTSQIR